MICFMWMRKGLLPGNNNSKIIPNTAIIKLAIKATQMLERLNPLIKDAISMINNALIRSNTAPMTSGETGNGIHARAGRKIMLAAHNSKADASNGSMPENDIPLSRLLVINSASVMTPQ